MSQPYYGQYPPPAHDSYGQSPPPPPPPQMPVADSYGPGSYQGQPNGTQDPYYQGQYQPLATHHQQQNQNGQYGSDSKMTLMPQGFQGERLHPKPKCHDIIFLLLFVIVFLGFTALSVISLRHYSKSNLTLTLGKANSGGLTLNGHTAVLFMLCCGVALVLSAVYIFFVRAFPTVMLEVTLFLSILSNVAFAVYLWVRHQHIAAIIYTVFAVFSVIGYFFMRKRIPLAKLLLVSIIKAANQYKTPYVIAMVGLVVETAFSAWVSWTIVAVYQRFDPSSQTSHKANGNAEIIGLMVFVGVAYFWISEVIKNVAFTTVAGVFGAWFYSSGQRVTGAACGAFRRAMSYSLGSICLGSLVVAILDLLRAVLTILSDQSQNDPNADLTENIIGCVASCCVGCVDGMARFFNRYAFINIALYGNSYVQASKQTFALLVDRGVDAAVNDSLVGIVFTCGAYVVGLLTALFAFIYEQKTHPQYLEHNDGYYSIILLVSFALGFNIALAAGSGSILSGVSTFFVALAEDPQLFAQKDPRLFEMIRKAYPQVVAPVV